ncbi:hypothetical protein HII31_05806 [Pseudocercospora fuligena]|uniref:Uncharacterized protein n=1 Tax=Pseudocercospora fuligena TaxID=685502 RepID=A0A8H6RLM9_9PEZI|nr:hypothetical protein HII31_05806 [Pseudocercospora fuligena]
MGVKDKVCSRLRVRSAVAVVSSRIPPPASLLVSRRRWAAQRSSVGLSRTENVALMEEISSIIQYYRVAAPKALLSPPPLRFVFEGRLYRG